MTARRQSFLSAEPHSPRTRGPSFSVSGLNGVSQRMVAFNLLLAKVIDSQGDMDATLEIRRWVRLAIEKK